MKWIAEYADLHGILMAPHGIFDGLFGIAAQVHLGAACPQNYVAFEYAKGQMERPRSPVIFRLSGPQVCLTFT